MTYDETKPVELQRAEDNFWKYIGGLVFLKKRELRSRVENRELPTQANNDQLELAALRVRNRITSPELIDLVSELVFQLAHEDKEATP